MRLKIYSIRDGKGDFFNTPFFQRTTGEAERTFENLTKDTATFVSKYPDDYDLFYIGDFDDQTGQITNLVSPVHICKANSLINKQISTISN